MACTLRRITKPPNQNKAKAAESVEAFVDLFVTPVRLEQALTESCTLPLSRKPLAGFLQWRTQDIKKVSTAKLEASGLEWKQVKKPVISGVRRWFQEKLSVALL